MFCSHQSAARPVLMAFALVGCLLLPLPAFSQTSATTRQAQRTKEAWDEMSRIDARTAPLAKKNVLQYWETFNVGYASINRDYIDDHLDKLIKDWVRMS